MMYKVLRFIENSATKLWLHNLARSTKSISTSSCCKVLAIVLKVESYLCCFITIVDDVAVFCYFYLNIINFVDSRRSVKVVGTEGSTEY